MFTVDAKDLTKFEKADWSEWGKENQFTSIWQRMENNHAPADALVVMALVVSEVSEHSDNSKWLAFNYHAPPGSTQSVTMQVICKKCRKATRGMHPFHNKKATDVVFVPAKMKEFAEMV